MAEPRVDIDPMPRTQAPPVLVAQLLALASFALFAAIAVAMLSGETQRMDESVLLWLRDTVDSAVPVGPVWLLEAMHAFTALGYGTTLTAIVLLGVGWFLYRGERLATGMLALTGVGGLLVEMAVKLAVDRPRPSVVLPLAPMDAWSFPSGHAMMTMAIFLALAVLIGRGVRSGRMRAALVGTALALSAVTGFSRFYLGVHYPSDVAAGWLLGVSWACVCWLIEGRLRRPT